MEPTEILRAIDAGISVLAIVILYRVVKSILDVLEQSIAALERIKGSQSEEKSSEDLSSERSGASQN